MPDVAAMAALTGCLLVLTSFRTFVRYWLQPREERASSTPYPSWVDEWDNPDDAVYDDL